MRSLLPLAPTLLLACAPGAPVGDDDTETVDTEAPGPACASPSWSAPLTAAGVETLKVRLQRAPKSAGTAGRFELRPVELSATGTGSVLVELSPPFKLHDEDGVALETPVLLDADDLPRTFLVGSRRTASGSLVARPEDGDPACTAASLTLETTTADPLIGRPTDVSPYVLPTRLFREDEGVRVSVPPFGLEDRDGLEGRVHVVRHRSPEAWEADPSLDDATDAPEAITLGAALIEGGVLVADGELGSPRPRPPRGYDLVVDLGDDGQLDPGDLVVGFGDEPAFWVTPDLSAPGPYTTSVGRARGGSTFLDEQIFWPTDTPVEARPLPLVVVSHGNGHDLTWYDHLGTHLASWGFVVMSHRNNTEPGIETASLSTIQNADWFLQNRETLLDGALAGLVDPTRQAWIGHSRGGEGVVRAWRRIESGNQVPQAFALEDVRTVGSIAPTVFQGTAASNVADLPYFLIVGGADGDVTGGVDCPLCQSMRIAGASLGQVTMVNVQGASHNVFHNGGGWDDGVGPRQLARGQVHPLLRAHVLAWVGEHLLGEGGFAEVFRRMPDDRVLPGVPAEVIYTVSRREGLDAPVWTVDDFQTEPDPAVASSGATVTCVDAALAEGVLDDGDARFAADPADPFNGMTLVSRDADQRGAVIAWSRPATCTWELPEPTDVSGLLTLALEATRSTRDPDTVAVPEGLVFALALEDVDGTVVELPTALAGTLPSPYPRGGLGNGEGWGNEWGHIALPLASYAARRVRLDAVVAVHLHLAPPDGSQRGKLGIDDLRFGL